MSDAKTVPDYLLLGFALSSIGGPLALIALYIIGASGPALNSLGMAALIGALLFVFPLFIWYNYSKKIASSGGLYEFVRQAAGEKVAKIQGWIWAFSYFLYLPYTVVYVVFYLIPDIFVVPRSYLYVLEIALPLILIAMVILSKKISLLFLFFGAILQLLVIIVLVWFVTSHTGISVATLAPNAGALDVFGGGFAVATLFICLDLPLFLGGEIKNGRKILGKVMVASFALVAAFVVIAAVLIPAGVTQRVASDAIPGFVLAKMYSNPAFAATVGIFVLVSVIGLVLAEFFALTRLMKHMLNIELSSSVLWISGLFMLMSLASLINPYKFYDYTLQPSLIALWISQLIPVIAYPSFLKRFSRLTAVGVFAALVSAALMLYGLYTAL
ncbi:MAG: APC family permease [Candidatus Micrarchaeota archaeon]|nr:APC family permease [Candidatus Micrarchaeota archaeon]